MRGKLMVSGDMAAGDAVLPSIRDRLEASKLLADRGWGKPEQPLTGADGEALSIIINLGGS